MTKFELLENVNFDNSYQNVIDFDNAEQQEQFFDGKVVQSFDDFTIVRKNEEIKIEENVNNVNSNYCRYTNTIDGVEKTFYAFITNKEYVNPEITRLTLEVDVWQTYMFDYEIKQSFIDRQHKDRFQIVDQVIKPKYDLVKENIDAGSEYDLLSSEKIKDKNNRDITWFCLLLKKPVNDGSYSSEDPSTYKNQHRQLTINQMGTYMYCYIAPNTNILGTDAIYTYDAQGNRVKINDARSMVSLFYRSNETVSVKALPYCPINYQIDQTGTYIFDETYDGDTATTFGKNVAVPLNNSEFKVPSDNAIDYSISSYGGWLLQISNFDETTQNIDIHSFQKNDFIPDILQFDIDAPVDIEKETKLHTFPFEYLQLSNYQTNPLKLKIENLPDTCNVKFRQNIDIIPKSKIWVENYNNESDGKENSVINSTIEEVTLWNNAFENYISQHRASATTGVALNVLTGVGMLGFGIATGGVGLVAGIGGAVGIGSKIANELIQREDLKQAPDNVRSLGNNLTFDIIDDNLKYLLRHFRIKEQFRQSIFKYFSTYGYKSNTFEIPDIRSRYYFNYIKTIGVNIISNVANSDIQKLKEIFDNGVTIWHFRNAETFKGLFNYEFENVEMSIYNLQNGGD